MNNVKNCMDASCKKPFNYRHPSERYCPACKIRRIAETAERCRLKKITQGKKEEQRVRAGQGAILERVFKTKERKRREEILRRYSNGL